MEISVNTHLFYNAIRRARAAERKGAGCANVGALRFTASAIEVMACDVPVTRAAIVAVAAIVAGLREPVTAVLDLRALEDRIKETKARRDMRTDVRLSDGAVWLDDCRFDVSDAMWPLDAGYFGEASDTLLPESVRDAVRRAASARVAPPQDRPILHCVRIESHGFYTPITVTATDGYTLKTIDVPAEHARAFFVPTIPGARNKNTVPLPPFVVRHAIRDLKSPAWLLILPDWVGVAIQDGCFWEKLPPQSYPDTSRLVAPEEPYATAVLPASFIDAMRALARTAPKKVDWSTAACVLKYADGEITLSAHWDEGQPPVERLAIDFGPASFYARLYAGLVATLEAGTDAEVTVPIAHPSRMRSWSKMAEDAVLHPIHFWQGSPEVLTLIMPMYYP